ncbi:MAG: alpha/beta hydrolase [Chloroflexi bacterium]|nr:alpha/beta hydrolase [Chloroflexota bacterium]
MLVLVHGYASSAAIWRYTLENLSPDRFRVIVLNNRGAGESDRTSDENDYTVETFADDLFNVVEALDLDGFTLIGHSMGGATVAQFALEHQDRIKGLVLMDSTPLNGRSLQDGWEEELRERANEPDPLAGDLGFNAPHVTEDFKRAVMADIARNPVERFIGGLRSMAGLKLRDRLGEINVPTLVIGCDQDTTVGFDNIIADYQALPPALRHLQIYHGFGHSPNVEVPRRVGTLIEVFSDMAWELDLKAEAEAIR